MSDYPLGSAVATTRLFPRNVLPHQLPITLRVSPMSYLLRRRTRVRRESVTQRYLTNLSSNLRNLNDFISVNVCTDAVCKAELS